MFNSKNQRHVNNKMRKRRLFHATDFQSLMYLCFNFCRILGIFPYKINASTFEISKPLYILSTVIICVYSVFYLVFVHGIIILEATDGDVTGYLHIVCYFTLNGLIVIITHILSIPRMHLLQTILKISSKLSLESHQKLSRLIHVKDILSIILLIVHGYTSLVTNMRLNIFERNYLNVLYMVFGIYVELPVVQINMLYINCVCILKACFKRINDDLMHMKRLINDMKPSIPSLICHMQRNKFLLIGLKTLMEQHLVISRTVHTLNIIFSLQLLATVIESFSEITFQLYFYLVRWQDGLLITFDWQFFDLFLVVMVRNIIKITLLVWACETGKNQAQKISTTIYDVVNSTRNEPIKDELQLFSLQTLHCKNTFPAKGLTVDAALLTAIAGSITTYMLILIQFLIMTHSCDDKSVINVT